MDSPASTSFSGRWQRFSAACLRVFHAYANWLVGISWRQFFLLAVLLFIIANLLQEVPPFSWRIAQTIVDEPAVQSARGPKPPKPPKAPVVAKSDEPLVRIQTPRPGEDVEITIDHRGVRVGPRPPPAASAPADAASAARLAMDAAVAAAASAAAKAQDAVQRSITINVPPGEAGDAVREAIEAVREAAEEARQAAQEARQEAEEARQEAVQEAREAAAAAAAEAPRKRTTTVVRFGDFLDSLAMAFILVSAAIKLVYKGRVQAEAKAAQATEVAEAESLKRQVVEARMAAMQAQVEPHFLFNTLASIDHLIETDPPRASLMQKNLIDLLRASMPSLREANAQGSRDLGQELAVIRPYLEILKVRMEDRLQTEINVPEGLHSAAFPPMMLLLLCAASTSARAIASCRASSASCGWCSSWASRRSASTGTRLVSGGAASGRSASAPSQRASRVLAVSADNSVWRRRSSICASAERAANKSACAPRPPR
jgi:hypothetical protein